MRRRGLVFTLVLPCLVALAGQFLWGVVVYPSRALQPSASEATFDVGPPSAEKASDVEAERAGGDDDGGPPQLAAVSGQSNATAVDDGSMKRVVASSGKNAWGPLLNLTWSLPKPPPVSIFDYACPQAILH